MNAEQLLNELNKEQEINPDLHDGSYELMREIIKSYFTVTDYSVIDYLDLNAVYAMAIGTWRLNPEKKKEYVYSGHLSRTEKDRMRDVIDRIWDHACRDKYEMRVKDKPSIGMFGTGFYSFAGMADQASSRSFIRMMVDISDLDDDDQIYDRAEEAFNGEFKGMQSAAASVMLHCLKPNVFPILNTNYGDGTIFEPLGIDLDRPSKLSTYIDNCRRIKLFRDSNVKIKNYRVFDRFARKMNYFPSLDEYDPGISSQQYVEYLMDESIAKKQWLDTIYYIFVEDGEATCSALASKYGETAQHYNSNAINLARAIQRKSNCKLSSRLDDSGDRFWAILFTGRYTVKNEPGSFSWRLRRPLHEAIDELDRKGFFDYLKVGTDMKQNNISKNTILYGPPGTGKTYNTVIYAVAIIENKSVESVKEEASTDYEKVKKRYDEYALSGRVAFTTFHQSYGYEEFIEGIKPKLVEGEDSIGYSVEDGIFKAFCAKASIPPSLNLSKFGINSEPAIWKVSLAGSHENSIRTECLENNHIRIGWDKYGPDISDRIDELETGKNVLNAFYNVMRIGDIVLSCFSATEIDAIGVITGECEWDDSYNHYKRVRKVRWIVKDIRENIVEYNKGYVMAPATVYWMGLSLKDVVSILEKYKVRDMVENNSKDNYVFIIDEINRGNISKIFGELITIIEETKRIGAPEAMKVKLPYSHSSFGVPDNVFILGTMNTADRSIAIMDTALRRRFAFEEMLPDTKMLGNMGISEVSDNGKKLDVAKMLDVINERIAFLYDREHTIGHAFFTPLKDNPSVDTLAMIFEKSIIPLLQEYFYEDYSKIQLVLGDDGKTSSDKKQYQFIRDEDVEPYNLFNSMTDMESSKKYTIQYEAFRKIESYKLIDKSL